MKLPVSVEKQKRFDENAERLVAPLRKGSGKPEQDNPTPAADASKKGAAASSLELEMTCPKCRGCGWVCEDHLDRPSDLVADEGGCTCGGAGAPCTCNPEAIYGRWLEIYAMLPESGEHLLGGSSPARTKAHS